MQYGSVAVQTFFIFVVSQRGREREKVVDQGLPETPSLGTLASQAYKDFKMSFDFLIELLGW